MTLLEILGLDKSEFEIGEKIYIGKEGRTKSSICVRENWISNKYQIRHKLRLSNVVSTIVRNNESRICKLY